MLSERVWFLPRDSWPKRMSCENLMTWWKSHWWSHLQAADCCWPSTLETVTLPSDEFVDALCERLEAFQTHSFIAKQQSQFYDQCKQSLNPAEVVVSAYFSENYSFVLQDVAQGFHWNNNQSTIHPFVIYFHDLSHASFVVISDCMRYYCCLLIPKEIDKLSQVKTWLSSKENILLLGWCCLPIQKPKTLCQSLSSQSWLWH